MRIPKQFASGLSFGKSIFLLVIASCLYFFLLHSLLPRFPSATFHKEGSTDERAFTGFWEKNATVVVTQQMKVGRISGTHIRILPDDCLNALTVNGTEVLAEKEGFCDYQGGRVFDLRPYIHTGTNELKMTIHNYSGWGGVQFRVAYYDPLYLPLHLSFALAVAGIVWFQRKRFWKKNWTRSLVVIAIVGVLLRFVYFFNTHYMSRAYDPSGHMVYINYLLTHWSLPSSSQGWESFQPPLYYVLSALIASPGKLLHAPNVELEILLQTESFLISSLGLLAGIWICTQLFKNNKMYVLIASAILAGFPGLAYSAARISNDVPLLALSFMFFGFLLRWWDKGRDRDWFIATFALALAILTKGSSLPLLGVLSLCLLLKKVHFEEKLYLGSISLLILTLFTGWFFMLRFGIEKQPHLVGNLQWNGASLQINTMRPMNYATIRPSHMITYPFTSAWNDDAGKRYFWEHLMKSSLSGDSSFRSNMTTIQRGMLFLMLLALPLAAFALVRDLWKHPRKNVPLWATFFFSIVAMMALVQQSRIGGFQDFRYAPILIFPALFYVFEGISLFPPWLRHGAELLTGVFAALCLAYIPFLLFVPW